MKKMTIWGVGPKIMTPGYLILFVLSRIPVKISIRETLNIPGVYINAVSFILIFLGIIMLAVASMDIKKALEKGQLATSGLFSRMRNPMYASHIIFIMPGVCFLTDKALTLLSIFCTLILFYSLISKEEKDLEENFGTEYTDYKKRVRRLLPGLKN